MFCIGTFVGANRNPNASNEKLFVPQARHLESIVKRPDLKAFSRKEGSVLDGKGLSG
jgi:hypothetical protein